MIHRYLKHAVFLALFVVVLFLCFVLYAFYATPRPTSIQYGVSFNTMYAGELGLDWREVYTAVLDDLQVR
nr:hypothetical protein [Candidatus Paceibacterota bacterium]